MTITLKLQLASGQSLEGGPLELLADGKPIARGVVNEHGVVEFAAEPGDAELAVRVDRSIIQH
ncbi:hypothetical protein KBJ94_29535 [Pseudomonas sp. ITA]|uniref:hypothetical protein n=1 Tax=Pseudomonas sp. ITA TaxID=2825841 RepID=UPI0024967F07|nr:hypothetical protein [Pseudomonas sp. ITA]MDI2146194.1 hypothetical protein [Pseudomonas sp. ITA]